VYVILISILSRYLKNPHHLNYTFFQLSSLFACTLIYYPTLHRVQITRETSTNITRYLYSSHSPNRAKDQKPWQVRILVKRKCWIIRYIYYPTLLRRVQITRETSTNITRYLYSSYSPDRAKDQKPWQVRISRKRKCWIINLLLHTETSKKIYIYYFMIE